MTAPHAHATLRSDRTKNIVATARDWPWNPANDAVRQLRAAFPGIGPNTDLIDIVVCDLECEMEVRQP